MDETRSPIVYDHYDNTHKKPKDLMIDRLKYSTGYQCSAWSIKDIVCELWVESRSFAGTVAPTCRKFDVDLVPMGGKTSWSNVYYQMEKIKGRNKRTVVLCLTDYDYSGQIIANSHEDAIKFFDTGRRRLVEFRHIGLTAEQVEEHGLSTLEPGEEQRKHAPHMTFACDLESMEIDEMSEFVSSYLREYITEEDIDLAERVEYELRSEERELGERCADWLRSQ